MTPGMQVVLIGVQFDGYGRAGNQTSASQALRSAGFADAFTGATDRGDVIAHNQSGARGPTSIINEPAMIATQASVRHRRRRRLVSRLLSRRLRRGLHIAARLRSRGSRRHGIHRPAAHRRSRRHHSARRLRRWRRGQRRDRSAARHGRPIHRQPTRRIAPALTLDALALLGQRDDAWRRDLNVSSLAHIGVWKRDAHQVALDPSGAARGAALHVAEQTKAWWLHVDVDVLDPAVFPAQGLPGVPDEPGGLTVEQLTVLVLTAVAMPECAGWSLATL